MTTRVGLEDDGFLSGGSDVDIGLALSVARRWGRSYLYGTFGYAWFGRDRLRGIPIEDRQATALVAFERRYQSRQALIVQYLRTDGLIPGFAPFDEASHEITLGWKMEVIAGGVVEVGLIENIVTFDNSPDFGFHAGFSRRF